MKMFKIQDTSSNNFDFIRLLLAVLVIFSHCYPLTLGTTLEEPIAKATHGYVSGGSLAVDTFFLISGYLVTASLLRSKSLWSYFRKRISRIYPGFIGVTLFNLLIVVPLASGHLRGSTFLSRAALAIFRTLALSDLRWVGAFSSNPLPGVVDGSLWTIPFEFSCYLILAVMGLCGIMRSKRTCLYFFALSWLVMVLFSIYVLNFNQRIKFENLAREIHFLPIFLAGAVAYLYRDKLQFSSLWAVVSLVVLCAVSNLPDGWECAFPLAGAYLVFFLAYNPFIRLKHFARHGDYSYGTYLYAFPIQQLVVMRWGGHISPIVLFCIATPLTLIAGISSWFLIERWFLSRSRVLH
jgi:peptidoglycan/LPS O-acetylase OafA/YrhL